MRPHPWTALLLLASCAGFTFSAVSTYDFVAHLDRQVHGIHCSFLPGLATPEVGGGGCQVTLMSPYSSVLRESVWGGIPISLPAMSVFAFLAFWAVSLLVRERDRVRRRADGLPARALGAAAAGRRHGAARARHRIRDRCLVRRAAVRRVRGERARVREVRRHLRPARLPRRSEQHPRPDRRR